ncbi:hypothetical protein CEK28_02115 [Xenophilus sp. AP218F]|nr:hypothetical protein [Chromobacterium sp. ASV5]OWY41087.1 hypothetical protein CEK28_02115 [Xenophilus sp. AP218F]
MPDTELFSFLILLSYLAALLWSLRHSWLKSRGRVYWLLSTLSLLGGLMLMLQTEPEAAPGGALPPEFGIGVLLALLGMLASAAGAALQLLARLRPPRGARQAGH